MRFALEQFDQVFEARNAAGKPYVLIGGQAVNYWAETYLVIEPELTKWRPFTSEDIDFQGGRDDVMRIAKLLGSSTHRLVTQLCRKRLPQWREKLTKCAR